MEWTTAADIKQQLQRYWSKGEILASEPGTGSLFPLSLRFRSPEAKALSEHFDEVRKWIRDLDQGSKAEVGFGYQIEWAEINHRQLGYNRVPIGVVVPTECDALRLIDRYDLAEQFRRLSQTTSARFPVLSNWLARHPLTVLEHAGDWERILSVLNWFYEHPNSGLYLRQVDIPGVDTKFIENCKGLLSELLDLVLPSEIVNTQYARVRDFERKYGLLSRPPLIRFRLLDKRLNLHGLSDLTVPVTQCAQLTVPADRVFITENEINGLAFPDVPGSAVIFGLGYGVSILAEIGWLRNKTLHYWGDIDTHGFAILDRLRAVFPHVQSLLMDRETLMTHRELWVREQESYLRSLTRLTSGEQRLFNDLKDDYLGEKVRLEQERIHFGCLINALQTLQE